MCRFFVLEQVEPSEAQIQEDGGGTGKPGLPLFYW